MSVLTQKQITAKTFLLVVSFDKSNESDLLKLGVSQKTLFMVGHKNYVETLVWRQSLALGDERLLRYFAGPRRQIIIHGLIQLHDLDKSFSILAEPPNLRSTNFTADLDSRPFPPKNN